MSMGKRKPIPAAPVSDITSVILESISEGVFTIDPQWRITSFNRAAEKITGIPRAEAMGRRCSDVFRASMCERDCALRSTMEAGTPIANRTGFIVDASGRRIPVSVSTALLRDRNGKTVGGVETFQDISVVEDLRRELEGRFQIGDIVSRSAAMRRISGVLPQIAGGDSTVLIQGETGTGKELLARAIHGMSPRSEKPFVAFNCGALPDTLLESELFGYKAGAFTGAEKDKPGLFAQAEGGTVFLDEIGDVSQALQIRLLRVLEEREFQPLGATKPVKADVRIIAATNKKLADMVKAGDFREDLFYRINVLSLELPPLRERREDIPLLVDRFVERLNRRRGREIKGMSRQALGILMAHDYPGNVRELENIIEHAFVLCLNDTMGVEHLPRELVAGVPRLIDSPNLASARSAGEARAIEEALRRSNNDRKAAAKTLGLHKSTLFRKMKALGIKPGRRRTELKK